MSFENESEIYLNKLLDEMKHHFNQSENPEVINMPESDSPNNNNMDSNCSNADVKTGAHLQYNDIYEPERHESTLKDSEKVDESGISRESNPELELANVNCLGEDSVRTNIEPPANCNKRSSRSNYDEKLDEGIGKRSSRRRSKDCNESILQSAIARKEKSYNEANKPQRLTRRLKPTQKVLENIALAKQEKLQDCTTKAEANVQRKSKHKNRKGKRIRTEDSDGDSDSAESFYQEYEFNPGKRRSQRLSRSKEDGNMDTSESSNKSSNVDEPTKENSDDPESIINGANLVASRVCLCTQNTTFFINCKENETVYCTAVDNIDDKLLGCSRTVDYKNSPMLRPSQRVPYGVLCELHRNRLIRHNCCPTCGQFCTQGRFLQCEANHQYHKDCQLIIGSTNCCPHCGLSAQHSTEIQITMYSSKAPIFLPVQKAYHPPAKMTFVLSKEKHSPLVNIAPLVPNEVCQILNSEPADDKVFYENDLLEAVVDKDLIKLAHIIASDNVHPNFKLCDFSSGTVLHFAAHRGLLSVVHLLVLGQAELDVFDKDQNTALMLAVSEGKNDVVQYLVAAGASITLKGTDGMTSLHLAAKCGNLQACKILLQSASSIRNYINVQDDGGWTPLVWACENGFVDVAKYLILKGADALLRDVEHNVALHWSAFSGSIHITELLLDLGSDVNVVNAHGDTPLHIGARENRYNCVIVLLARGADISVANKNNETPLDCAPEDGDCYNVIALNVRLQPEGGWMPEKRKTLLSNDISRGRELNPIQCINEVNDESEPRDYVYITKNSIASDTISIDARLATVRSCKCEERCVSSECSCGETSLKCWYDEEGKLLRDFNFTDPPLIFECNEACMCNSITCTNRVVQKGLTQRFQLYKTKRKGWGIQTLRFIPKGSFVCEYIGEILTDVDADQREDDSYLFDLDNREMDSFCIDARKYGNFARFINHSCDPNLHSVKVFIDHQDLRFPRIALFAQRDILANEELSFDYGHKFWLVKYKCFTCECQAANCKYSHDTIQEALDKYNMLMEKNASTRDPDV